MSGRSVADLRAIASEDGFAHVLEPAADLLDRATQLIRKMVAIHGQEYDLLVTSETYPGEKHEEAEEAWIIEAVDYLRSVRP